MYLELESLLLVSFDCAAYRLAVSADSSWEDLLEGGQGAPIVMNLIASLADCDLPRCLI